MKNDEYTYNYKIDFQSNNPSSIILKEVKEKSKVLELGPSTGYMTKYLTEELGCRVTCIEIDENSAQISKQYCEKMIVGNLDQLKLDEILQEKYDYVLMADVLEHLFSPEDTLKQIKKVLQPGGVLWLSIPNISHISIIQQLIENQFSYGKWGLLDNTHIRFFTRNTIKQLLQKLEYQIVEERDIVKYPNETEFNSKHLESNFIKTIIQEKNPDLYTYQMVFKLKFAKNDEIYINKNINTLNSYKKEHISKLYIDLGHGFNEENTTTTNYTCLDNKFYITFKAFDNIKKMHAINIRFDLLEGNFSYIKILGASYKDNKNIIQNISLDKITSNANLVKEDNGMYFFTYDPQIYFNVEDIYLRNITIWGECKIQEDLELSKYLLESFCDCGKIYNKIKEQEEIIEKLRSKIEEIEPSIKIKDKKINEYNNKIEELNEKLKEKNERIQQHNKMSLIRRIGKKV